MAEGGGLTPISDKVCLMKAHIVDSESVMYLTLCHTFCAVYDVIDTKCSSSTKDDSMDAPQTSLQTHLFSLQKCQICLARMSDQVQNTNNCNSKLLLISF